MLSSTEDEEGWGEVEDDGLNGLNDKLLTSQGVMTEDDPSMMEMMTIEDEDDALHNMGYYEQD